MPAELLSRVEFFKPTAPNALKSIQRWTRQALSKNGLKGLWHPLEGGTMCDETGKPRRTDVFYLCSSGPEDMDSVNSVGSGNSGDGSGIGGKGSDGKGSKGSSSLRPGPDQKSQEEEKSAEDLQEPRDLRRRHHPRLQKYLDKLLKSREETIERSTEAGIVSINDNPFSSNVGSSSSSSGAASSSESSTNEIPDYRSIRQSRRKAARRQSDITTTNRNYAAFSRYKQGQTSWAAPVPIKLTKSKLEVTDLSNVSGALRRMFRRKLLGEDSSEGDVSESMPGADSDNDLSTVDSNLDSLEAAQENISNEVAFGENGELDLSFLFDDSDASLEGIPQATDVFKTISNTTTAPSAKEGADSKLKSTKTTEPTVPLDSFYSAFSQFNPTLPKNKSKNSSDSTSKDDVIQETLLEFPHADLLLNQVLPGSPEIVAIAETLCEYVVLVRAPQLCSLPQFFDGGLFSSRDLEQSNVKHGVENGANTVVREVLECS